ncbi:hypothetical protein ACFSUK_08185 [Sphingobium scionense]
MVRAARRAVRLFLDENPDLEEVDRQERVSDIFSQTLIRAGMREWEGIGDIDGNVIQPSTPGALDTFMQRAILVEAPTTPMSCHGRCRTRKNVSAPSSDGISARATQDMTIATSAAPARKAKDKGAKPARTAKKSRVATPAKVSGTS